MTFEILERANTSVSAVVDLIDEFTGKLVTLPLKSVLDKSRSVLDRRTVLVEKNGSRFVFTGPPPKTLEFRITSDYFFDKNKTLQFEYSEVPDIKRETIMLHPLPCYPFPVGTTIFRGVAVNSEGKAAKNATVILGKNATASPELARTVTSAKGEFVFYFKTTVLTDNNPLFKILQEEGVSYLIPKSNTEVENSMALKVEGSTEDAYPIKIIWGISSSLGKDKKLVLSL